jgi:hypothetical protein
MLGWTAVKVTETRVCRQSFTVSVAQTPAIGIKRFNACLWPMLRTLDAEMTAHG